MAKFCGKCGSKLDDTTGLCPNCDTDKLKEQSDKSEPVDIAKSTQETAPTSEKPLSKKEAKKKRKADKKAEKKEKRAQWSTGKRVRRFLFKAVLILIALVIGVLGALVYYDVVEIPFLSRWADAHRSDEKSVEITIDKFLSNTNEISIVDEQGAAIDTLSGGRTAQKMFESISFSVLDTKEDNGTITADVSFTVPDTMSMLDEYLQTNPSDHSFALWLTERLQTDFPTLNCEIPVVFYQKNGEMTLVADQKLYNVLTGGARDYYVQQQKSLYESYQSYMGGSSE